MGVRNVLQRWRNSLSGSDRNPDSDPPVERHPVEPAKRLSVNKLLNIPEPPVGNDQDEGGVV